MKINIQHYGEVEYTSDKIIDFKNGLLGFEKLTKFLLIKEDEQPFFLLNSIDEPGIAFPLFGVRVIDDKYPEEEGYEPFGIVTLNNDPLKITVNLKAPVYINQNLKSGFQKIFENVQYRIDYNLFTES